MGIARSSVFLGGGRLNHLSLVFSLLNEIVMVEFLRVVLKVLRRRMHISITASWFLEHVVHQGLLLLLSKLVSVEFSSKLLLIAVARSSIA